MCTQENYFYKCLFDCLNLYNSMTLQTKKDLIL